MINLVETSFTWFGSNSRFIRVMCKYSRGYCNNERRNYLDLDYSVYLEQLGNDRSVTRIENPFTPSREHINDSKEPLIRADDEICVLTWDGVTIHGSIASLTTIQSWLSLETISVIQFAQILLQLIITPSTHDKCSELDGYDTVEEIENLFSRYDLDWTDIHQLMNAFIAKLNLKYGLTKVIGKLLYCFDCYLIPNCL